MRRRAFIAGVGAAAFAPFVAQAQQQARVRRVGVLMTSAQDADGTARLAAFQKGLQALGWRDGANMRVDVRWGAADTERIRAIAKELVGTRPDVILATSGRVVRILQGETRELPIVFVGPVDPVAAGHVASIARPGGNTTGFTSAEDSFAAKWLEILKEVAPAVKTVGFIASPDNPAAPRLQGVLQKTVASFGVRLIVEPVRNAADVERAVATVAREPDAGLILPLDLTISVYLPLLAELTVRHRMPAVSGYASFSAGGGLISYGPDVADTYRRAASYVDRILKGEKPADLPVQAPDKFQLAINLKTARTLGLAVPPTLLARADEVIE
jgi:putative tryptophan/tyrosine transport system substrate-binding protein